MGTVSVYGSLRCCCCCYFRYFCCAVGTYLYLHRLYISTFIHVDYRKYPLLNSKFLFYFCNKLLVPLVENWSKYVFVWPSCWRFLYCLLSGFRRYCCINVNVNVNVKRRTTTATNNHPNVNVYMHTSLYRNKYTYIYIGRMRSSLQKLKCTWNLIKIYIRIYIPSYLYSYIHIYI